MASRLAARLRAAAATAAGARTASAVAREMCTGVTTGSGGARALSATASVRCALCPTTVVTRAAGAASTMMPGDRGAPPPTAAPDPSAYFSADVPLSDEARAWFAEKEPKSTSGARATQPDIPGPGEPLGPTESEPLFPPDPHRRKDDGERDPDYVKRAGRYRRDSEPLEPPAESQPAGALPREGEPRAISTTEYWRGDVGTRTPDPTARPESTGDAGYQ